MRTCSAWSYHSYCRRLDGPEHGLSYDVVMRLAAALKTDVWHAIGMDGFFSSVRLFTAATIQAEVGA